jgi:hypothetical protein
MVTPLMVMLLPGGTIKFQEAGVGITDAEDTTREEAPIAGVGGACCLVARAWAFLYCLLLPPMTARR